jgi:hypothetical protein
MNMVLFSMLFATHAFAWEVKIINRSDKKCLVEIYQNKLFTNDIAGSIEIAAGHGRPRTGDIYTNPVVVYNLITGYCPSGVRVTFYNADASIYKVDYSHRPMTAKCWNVCVAIADWYSVYFGQAGCR